jgi:hypothetical protein
MEGINEGQGLRSGSLWSTDVGLVLHAVAGDSPALKLACQSWYAEQSEVKAVCIEGSLAVPARFRRSGAAPAGRSGSGAGAPGRALAGTQQHARSTANRNIRENKERGCGLRAIRLLSLRQPPAGARVGRDDKESTGTATAWHLVSNSSSCSSLISHETPVCCS